MAKVYDVIINTLTKGIDVDKLRQMLKDLLDLSKTNPNIKINGNTLKSFENLIGKIDTNNLPIREITLELENAGTSATKLLALINNALGGQTSLPITDTIKELVTAMQTLESITQKQNNGFTKQQSDMLSSLNKLNVSSFNKDEQGKISSYKTEVEGLVKEFQSLKDAITNATTIDDLNQLGTRMLAISETVKKLQTDMYNSFNASGKNKGTFMEGLDLTGLDASKNTISDYIKRLQLLSEFQNKTINGLKLSNNKLVFEVTDNGTFKKFTLDLQTLRSLVEQTQKSSSSFYNQQNKMTSDLTKLDVGSIDENAAGKISSYKSEVLKLKQEYADLQKAISNATNTNDLAQLDSRMKALANSVSKIKSDLYNTTNASGKNKGTLLEGLDFSGLDASKNTLDEYIDRIKQLKEFQNKTVNGVSLSNNKLVFNVDDGGTIRKVTVDLLTLRALYQQTVTASQQAGQGVASSTSQATSAIQQLATAVNGLKSSLGNLVSMYFSLYRAISFIKSGVNVVKEFNDSMATINMTMDVSLSQLNNLSESVIQMSKSMSTSMSNSLDVAKIYANMNTTPEEILQLSLPTLMLANASGLSADTSASYIRSVLNQFKLAESDAEHVVDVFEQISANINMDFTQGIQSIAEGVQTAGTVAEKAGFSVEQFGAIIAKTAEQTGQGGSQIANSWKTILTRISRAKDASDEVIDPETLSNASKSLSKIGIQVYDQAGNFNDINNILSELTQKWGGLSDAMQQEISYNLAA